ncbi:hypothetical protein [Ornithinimicrobium murale]|uniref:hypothetical protein n=1 Tax=Ornithinimicrobium murale TaxID=1050153 RepID=UPI000E0D2FC7|nr:hypothetical protein [Ornithinimicrobium murale]
MKQMPELSPEPSNDGEIPFNEDPEAELGLFAGCHTPTDLRRVFRAEVDTAVEQMLALVTDADAFDVIELMRMQEFFPLSPLLTLPDASALNVEIVAAMLLGRPSRRRPPTPHEDSRPDGVIPEIRDRSSRLIRLANYRHLSEAKFQGDSLALLAAQYQSSVLLIRNLRYDSIRDAQDSQLFDNPRVTPLMSEYLGYTYPDVVAVRSTMKNLGGERLESVVDETIDVFGRDRGTAQADMPEEGRKALQVALEKLLIRPAGRAVMTPAQVAQRAGISETAAFAVMNSSAQEFDPSVAPADRVFELLTSTNPFLAKPLVSDGAGNFVETTIGVGLDSLRRTVEGALTNTKHWHTYDQKVRQVVSERLALDSLQRVLGAPPALAGVKYYAPTDDASAHLLGRDSADLKSVGKIVEGDGLFVIGDVAICVEVKGKSMSAPARRGRHPPTMERPARDDRERPCTGCTSTGAHREQPRDLVARRHLVRPEPRA